MKKPLVVVPKGNCSKCGENWFNCHCNVFSPNIITGSHQEGLVISKDEAENLYRWAEYQFVSEEHFPLVKGFLKRLEKFIQG